MLQKGDTAPDFTLYSDAKEPFSLAETRSDGPVVLLFFPAAFSSVCTTELNTVGNDYSRYQDLGATVVGISTDTPFALAEFRSVHGFPFPLLSDHDGDIAAAYGVKYDRDFGPMKLSRIAKRSAFVVAPGGTLSYAEVTENAGRQPDFEAILESLRETA